MNETGKQLLTVLDRALTESPREAAAREGRTLLKQIHTRFGPEVARQYASRILSPGGRAEMQALLSGPAPARGPAPTPVKATVPGLLPPAPPKPAEPVMSTNVLHKILFASVQANLPIDYGSLAEAEQRRALLVGAWKARVEDCLPADLRTEVEVAVAAAKTKAEARGTPPPRRVESPNGAARTVIEFRRQSIRKAIKKVGATT